jgi:5-methyltetrahydrofolate--homocysteine methyltransferase
MDRKYTKSAYLQALDHDVLIFDGAMGTNLQAMHLGPEQFGGERLVGCNDYLVISDPPAVEDVHRSFLEVGVDVIETDSFRANRITLKDYGLQDQTLRINLEAASLARRLADEYSRKTNRRRFVAGSMGPSGKLLSMNDPALSDTSFDELADVFREQALGLIEGGVDLLLIETSQDLLEVKAAIHGIRQAFSESGITLPIQAQVTLDTNGRMLLGSDISAVGATLSGLPIDVIGVNCSTGPDYMRAPIAYLAEHTSLPVSCIPNAGLPMNIDGQAVYPLQPEPFVEELSELVQANGINVVGGCCGTTPEHLDLLVRTLRGEPRREREIAFVPELASATQSQPIEQEPRPFLIGERLNTQGSRKFKQLVLQEDFDAMLSLAREQAEAGAHALDLCVALTERSDERELMTRLVKTLAQAVSLPFVIDSTDPDVMEAALKANPGRSLLNSTHLEGGRAKADRVFSLAKDYNAAVICLTIDEKGMARTAEQKLGVARRLYAMATEEHGLRPSDLVFDPLTFTLPTGDAEYADAAQETLEGIRRIKAELPGVFVSLGISNVSFGLRPEARAVLNSAMLYHAVQAGLDLAIVNPAQIIPFADLPAEARELAEDLIFNRREDALQRFIASFDQGNGSLLAERKSGAEQPPDDLGERLFWRIVYRHREGVEADIDALVLSPGQEPAQAAVRVLNEVLLPAMKEVGDRFGRGELILPFVLQSAEVMKQAVSHLESYLQREEGLSKGTLVLATVYGDVHDIGKNLVKTIVSNNGYRVIDLGKQVPAETIISEAVAAKADAIGLSALLVTTSKQMPLIVNELDRRGLHIPVLIGGAAINDSFARHILRTEQGHFYDPGVFYCKDAFEGLETLNTLLDAERRPELVERVRRDAERELGRAARTAGVVAVESRSSLPPAEHIPQVPRWGAFTVKDMPLDAVFQCLSKRDLFRLSWGAKNAHGEAWEKLLEEFEQRLERMRREALRRPWLRPQGVYGYWPAQSAGDELILYDPERWSKGERVETERFRFPRQRDGERLCLADYFASEKSGRMDVVALQVVTVGEEADERFQRLQDAGDYGEAYFVHGLAVQMAEASAEYLHRHVRQELGLAAEQGKRYSWGYPAIPDLADHAKVFRLLPAERELGMSLTAGFQLVPEESTAAIIVHHPLAKYFGMGELRIQQLLS